MRRLNLLSIAVQITVAMWLMAPAGRAAVLVGLPVNTAPGTAAVNLTTQGTVDWAIWNFTNTTGAPSPQAATNRKSGGTASISSMSVIGTGSLRGSGGSSIGTKLFTYTDGANSPTSITSLQQSLIFSTALNADGSGVQFSLRGDPAQLYEINIWATGFNAQGTLTASLNGVSDVSLVSQLYGASKEPTLFTFRFQPNSATDDLIFKYVMPTDGTGDNSHVGIQAVTVSIVPEPSVALMSLAGVIGMTVIRRRRKMK